jgi:hypothetical protein
VKIHWAIQPRRNDGPLVTIRLLPLGGVGPHDGGLAKRLARQLRRHRSMRTSGYLLAALITGMTVAAPSAGATEARAAPETFLVLGVASHGHERFVTLHCDPPSGTHPHPEGTCNALLATGGNIEEVVGQPDMRCPDIYDPATATASGQYQGARLIFRRTYPNHCELDTETAPVFQF